MNEAVSRVLDVLKLERVAPAVFEGVSTDPEGSHLFGGQVIAQALAAADRMGGEEPAHSLHGYFLKRGTPTLPIRFEVRELRRSRAFQTLQVVASQEGREILHLMVSRHEPEEGLAHQIDASDLGAPGGERYEEAVLRVMTPDGAPTKEPSQASRAESRAVPNSGSEGGGRVDEVPPHDFELAVEMRSVEGFGLFSEEKGAPRARCWMRMQGDFPDDPALHRQLFAYASDYPIMAPALAPHPVSITSVQSASLDHAIWFHQPFRMDAWLLFELESPSAAGARATSRGLLYTTDGRLVASCTQEALFRPLPAS